MRALLQFFFGKPEIWAAFCLGWCVFFAMPVRAEERMMLEGVRPASANVLPPTGRLPAAQQLHFAFALSLRNQGELTELTRQLYDPASTNYHKFLTSPEFTARFGPTEADYAAVSNFAVTNGFSVARTHPNRLLLDVAGRTADIERAFGITLRIYRHPTEARNFFAPDADPSVPTNLPVADLCGLSDFALPQPQSHMIDPKKITPLNYDGSGPSGEYRGADFRNAYAPGSRLTGTGQVVALAEFDGYYPGDITSYEAQCGYTNVPLTNVLMSGVTGNPSANANHVGEVSLDIELAIVMAPGLSQVIVYEGQTNAADPYDVFNKIATDNLAKQISCSWGWEVPPRWYWKSPDHATTLDSILSEMVVQGQAFFQASGDSDAYTGNNALSTTTGPIPVDSPYVTSCGGTALTMSGTGSAWSSEAVWNRGNNIGSGGGSSPNYPIPVWQTNVNASIAANGGSTTERNIPDVALTADAVYVIYNGGTSGSFYGTSCAAPLWAGFCALANQQALASGFVTNSIGFLNPALYAIAAGTNYPACFHDITTGNNIGTNTPGLFYAATGYDLCTGLGTPNGTNLINVLAPPLGIVTQPSNQIVAAGSCATFTVAAFGLPPLGCFWQRNGTNIPGATGTNYTLCNARVSDSGSQFACIVSNGFGEMTSASAMLTVNLLTTTTTVTSNRNPSIYGGSVTFTANVLTNEVIADNASSNCVFSVDGLAVTTNALIGGQASYTNNTLTAGNHTIQAVYLGDAVYAPSTNCLTQTNNARALVLTGTRAYDGTTMASSSILTISNLVAADNFSLTGSAILASPNVGTNFITATNLLTLPDTGVATNYTLVGAAGAVIITQAVSTLNLVSSNPTNGFHDSVNFTSTVPAFVNSGAVVFRATNTAFNFAFSTNNISSGIVSSLAITNLPRGADAIWAQYAGDSNVLGCTNDIIQTVTNHPPVALAATYYRADGFSLKIALTNLLAYVTDADGDSLTLQSVGTGTNGATILTNGAYIYYLSAAGAGSNDNDSFTYTVNDGFGGSATSNVLVDVYSAVGPSQMSIPTNGVVNITFFSIPNETFMVQMTTNLSGPWWAVSTNTIGTNGFWLFTDPNATNPQQFYRLTQP